MKLIVSEHEDYNLRQFADAVTAATEAAEEYGVAVKEVRLLHDMEIRERGEKITFFAINQTTPLFVEVTQDASGTRAKVLPV